jgi:hypothetical protein
MMGVDHVVADLELDVDDYALDVEIFELNSRVGNGGSSFKPGPRAGPFSGVQVCK